MANHSCPGYSDVWPFCNNDFIFVMSTCRFLIRPGRGAGGRVPCYPCVRPAANSTPTTRCYATGGMLSSRARILREYWLGRQLPIGTGSRYIALPKRICSKKAAIEHRHMNCQKGSCVLYLIIHRYRHQLINSLWPGDAIWRHRTGSIFSHLMASLPDGTSHYINHCWLVIS